MTARRAFIVTAAGLVALAFAGISAAAEGPTKWQAGQHYKLLPQPVPTSVGAGKVEVIEVFWYGCGHCFALDPVLEDWKAGKAEYIEFSRMPVIWGPAHRQHAKLFYTALALRKPEIHTRIFNAIHEEGEPLADRDEVTARKIHANFFTQQGVTPEQFDGAYDSMMVASHMQRADAFTRKLNIDNVPMVVINGKYSTSVGEAGGQAQLLALIDHLAETEKP